MADEMGEKTESATPKRREDARKRGQYPTSRDLTSAVILLSGLVAIQVYGEGMLELATRLVRYCLSTPWIDLDLEKVRIELGKMTLLIIEGTWPFLAVVFGTAVVITYIQTGGPVFASEKSFLDLDRLNPLTGLQRIFSMRGLVKTVLDIAKVLIIGLISYTYIADHLPALAALSRIPFPTLGAYTLAETLTFSYYLVAVLIALAVADFVYQRVQFEQDLKMTRQEVKDEARDAEGDPRVKAKRRQIQLKLARQRMIKEVPEAEVVITNPTHLAVALKYKVEKMDAPVVIAMGAGVFAQRIRELAQQHNIPIIENKPLAQLLFHTAEVGRVIPQQTFIAVAEIMAYVYQITKKHVPPRPK